MHNEVKILTLDQRRELNRAVECYKQQPYWIVVSSICLFNRNIGDTLAEVTWGNLRFLELILN